MGAYHEVVRNDAEVCPRCGSTIERIVQYKYGEAWQHRYVVGDSLTWGRTTLANQVKERLSCLGILRSAPYAVIRRTSRMTSPLGAT
jgi:Zinc finger found in FPG and IleRS